MPLFDHFRPRCSLPWPSLFNGWAGQIVEALNGVYLSDDYVAYEFVTLHGHPEVGGLLSAEPRIVGPDEPRWQPPAADRSHPSEFPESVEVRVRWCPFPEYKSIVVLVTPTNKATHAARIGLAARCVSYLQTGAAVALVDVVTSSPESVHNEVLRLLDFDPHRGPELGPLYAASYRPAERKGGAQLDIWTFPLALGDVLPVIPLRATADKFVPIDLEATYAETCRRRKFRV